MLGKDRPVQHFDIMLHKIREIIMDEFGFRLWLNESGQVVTFLFRDIDKKAQLVQVIKENAGRYMQVSLSTTVTETSNSNIVASRDRGL